MVKYSCDDFAVCLFVCSNLKWKMTKNQQTSNQQTIPQWEIFHSKWVINLESHNTGGWAGISPTGRIYPLLDKIYAINVIFVQIYVHTPDWNNF